MRPKFDLGQTMMTPGARAALQASGQEATFFLSMHVSGNWGNLCRDDVAANEAALRDGSRILSSYRTLKNARLWIITEAEDDDGKRPVTTLLLPDEY